MEYADLKNAQACEQNAFDVELDGLKCIALNTGHYSSRSYKSVWNPETYDAMLAFAWKGELGQWRCSLYVDDKEGIDVSKTAVKFGGGGHAGAAGFQVDELPFTLKKRSY
jgi:oligoribonuclease NrnB/cAMP/cGMP phosphodiesterase (DHH superfamily)